MTPRVLNAAFVILVSIQLLLPCRAQDPVLVNGDPPLTQQIVERLSNFMGWMMEVPFTREQRQMIRDHIVTTWKKGDKEEIRGVTDLLGIQDQLAPLDAGRREIVRAKIAEAYLVEAKKAAIVDPLTKMFLSSYETAHKPIAEGKPPLTRQATDAYLEMLCFMAGEAATEKPYDPSTKEKDVFAKHLAERYAKLGTVEKEQMSKLPLMWAGMRWAWNDSSEEQKKMLRKTWAQALTSMVQAQQPSTALPPPSPTGDQPPDTITVLSKMTPEQASAEMMRRLQNKTLAANTLNNIMTMKYESSMNIIRNMNSGIRYEYRYK